MSTPIDRMMRETLYAVLTDHGSIGIGSADMTPDFDEALDLYTEARKDGSYAQIWAFPVDGMRVNLTATIDLKVVLAAVSQGRELPVWLEDAA